MPNVLILKIEHHPENGLSVNGKSAEPIKDFFEKFAHEHGFNLHEMLTAVIDIVATQAAGVDYDDGDTEHGMLQFVSAMLGKTYSNALKGFAEGAIMQYQVPPHNHGAN